MPEWTAELAGVTKRFDAVVALHELSVAFRAGQVHAVLGENGSGKSTTVRILSGALVPDEGTVLIEGHPVALTSPRQGIRAGIAAAYQESALVRQLSVAQNIALGHERTRLGVLTGGSRRRARRWLDEVGLAVDPGRSVRGLSVAQQQLVAIAKALSLDARLLILDEPTAALNGVEAEHLFSLVAALRARGLAILYITHRLAEVERLADLVTVLKDGRLVCTKPAPDLSHDDIVQLMVGRTVSQLFPPRPAVRTDVALCAENLETRDGGLSVPYLAVRSGEILGIAGLEGSGRSTLARVLAGVEPGARGRLTLGRDHLAHPSPVRAVRRGLGFVPPDRRAQGIVPTFSVGRCITLSALRGLSVAGILRPRRERDAAQRFIRRFTIRTTGTGAPIRTLSGGNQQKVVLARALCAGTRVLVCDEPTAGVDVGARSEIYEALATLAGEGMGVVVSSADMLELLGLCHRIVVMREGRIAADMPAESTSEEALMRAQLPERSPMAA